MIFSFLLPLAANFFSALFGRTLVLFDAAGQKAKRFWVLLRGGKHQGSPTSKSALKKERPLRHPFFLAAVRGAQGLPFGQLSVSATLLNS